MQGGEKTQANPKRAHAEKRGTGPRLRETDPSRRKKKQKWREPCFTNRRLGEDPHLSEQTKKKEALDYPTCFLCKWGEGTVCSSGFS